ncbi:MAG: DNA polymerase III subunit epsilon [Actinobacteria bacterium]|nr:MAG: DNA polymerase III subunit epsilon [Actinomycetota bacterium]
MTWTEVPWLGFDTETTGVDSLSERLVTAALVLRLGGATPTGADAVHTWLADPGVPIPERASKVHGITTEYARAHGRPVEEVLDEVAATLVEHWRRGYPVVAFNATYDVTLVNAELARHELATFEERLGDTPMLVIDPLVIDRAKDRFRKGKKTLGVVAPVYGVECSENAHTAEYDVAMTLDVLASMAQRFDDLASMTCAELHEFQKQAHVAWADGYEQYLRSRGRDASISRAWPQETLT